MTKYEMIKDFLKTIFGLLDSPGGHIVLGLLLIASGMIGFKLNIQKSEDLLLAGLTIAGFAAKGQNGKGIKDGSTN
jgi:hypothetical protein